MTRLAAKLQAITHPADVGAAVVAPFPPGSKADPTGNPVEGDARWTETRK